MSDLVEFLTARLDEDNEAALDMLARDWTLTGRDVMTAGFVIAEASSDLTGRHIARHDPARVLREVEAKRKILDLWHNPAKVEHLPEGAHEGRDPDEIMRDVAVAEAIDEIVRTLAAVYSDHPDYDEAWRSE
jgi:Family of unknown function (DUF6221)